MNTRILPIVNAIGCIVLIGLVVSQWGKERSLGFMLESTTRQLAIAREETAKESARRSALERDIAVLKEAIEATQKAAESTTRELSEQSTLATGLQSELDTSRAQVTAWEAAIKTRDQRILELGDDLAAARKRLDQAIARIKAVEK